MIVVIWSYILLTSYLTPLFSNLFLINSQLAPFQPYKMWPLARTANVLSCLCLYICSFSGQALVLFYRWFLNLSPSVILPVGVGHFSSKPIAYHLIINDYIFIWFYFSIIKFLLGFTYVTPSSICPNILDIVNASYD